MSYQLFFETYAKQIVATFIALIIFVGIRFLTNSLIVKFSKKTHFSASRGNLIKRYIDYFIFSLGVMVLISIWGIKSEQLFLFVSSVLTVIGVAFFAQWSILSNITAGIIVFFSLPFNIGDKIRILDKEHPIEAEIIDIKSFHTLLKTKDGEEISFPNNLLLQKGIVIVKKSE